MSTQSIPYGIDFPYYLQQAVAAVGRLFASPTVATREELAASADANEVRELANSYAKTDPGFASDLYAAAARHEGVAAN